MAAVAGQRDFPAAGGEARQIDLHGAGLVRRVRDRAAVRRNRRERVGVAASRKSAQPRRQCGRRSRFSNTEREHSQAHDDGQQNRDDSDDCRLQRRPTGWLGRSTWNLLRRVERSDEPLLATVSIYLASNASSPSALRS